VAEDVQVAAVTRRAGFSASRDGLIAYQTGGVGRTALAWMDRAGKLGSVLDDKHFYFDIAMSPDGKQVAATRVNPNTMGWELWVTDVARGIATRIVPEGVETAHPVWSPDGRQIAYDSPLDGVFVTRADGTGKQELLAVGGSMPHWSPDGNLLVFSGKDGLSLVSTAGDRKVTPYLAGNFRQAAFSPDGRWMAYVSQQSGTWEVFVESVPAGHGKWQISTRGGAQPVWRRDRAELFYMSADRKIMAVLVRTGAGFDAAAPRELLPVAASGLFNVRNHYAITADGQHFLIIPRLDDHAPMFLLQNWLSAAR
jgi:dipeptidyl aminopeptidase/acylaminoacyl peptidase